MGKYPGHKTRRVTLPRVREARLSDGYSHIQTDTNTLSSDGSEQTVSITGAGGITVEGTEGNPDAIVVDGQTIQDAVDAHIADLDNPHQTSTASAMADLTDVSDTDTPVKNDVVIFNGSEFVFAPYNTTFTFSIATFTDTGGSTTVEIGTGTWKAIGALSFSATYNNGPATDGYVSLSGWAGNLTLTGGSFEGPTVNTEAVSYPSVGSSRVFTLHATDGVDNDTDNNTYVFYNRRFWGVSTTTDSYTEADIEGLASNELSNSRAKSFTVNASAGEYIIYSYPTRLGTATFTVGGFEGGFEAPETVSVTNASGYTENYYVYRSTNSGLGSTTVVVS